MKIWVDADACPTQIRDIICRAVMRRCVPATFVANKKIALPPTDLISFVLVLEGPDVADAYIAEHADAGDLAVTQDIRSRRF